MPRMYVLLLLLLARFAFAAPPPAPGLLAMNATALPGSIAEGGAQIYRLPVPVDTNGAAVFFFVVLSSDDDCVIGVDTVGPAQSYATNVTFPGRWPVYYGFNLDKADVGMWTITLTGESSSCQYLISATSTPVQPITLGSGVALWEGFDPLAVLHFNYGTAGAVASALQVKISYPGKPAQSAWCGVSVEVDVLSGGGMYAYDTPVAPNGTVVLGFYGENLSQGTYGEDWAYSGFYAIGDTPANVYIGARVNSSLGCGTIVVAFEAFPVTPLSLPSTPSFNISTEQAEAYVFSVQAPANDYKISITYEAGNCEWVAWAGNPVTMLAGSPSAILGYQVLNSTQNFVQLQGPAHQDYIWVINAEDPYCILSVALSS
eukprot:Mycagemm_TRINITY_DN9481_c0_g1::TRINITY_DN9481_c0_g1_i1::g.3058::m.3058 type:complete len:373 gc:universal TRINITY_DN9481_c0_g1_i1:23-1141(+)